MSSRQEEKERRRQERVAKEQAEAHAAGRRKRLQLAFGGVLALVLVAGLVAVAVGLVGGKSGKSEDEAGKGGSPSSKAKLPVQQVSDIKEAAKAAGCKLANPAFEGQGHAEKAFKVSDYKSNPPTSGDHTPDWYEDGIYAPGDTPSLGKTVHPLEHGRIEVQYKPGTPQKTVDELEALLGENDDGYHMLLFENTSGMSAQVAATAWTHSLSCPAMNDKVFDAIRTFRSRYIDKGPEQVP
ncbi:MAG: DUF3105 domain-containing protein [Solirubrobacteraceae bacterium]